LIHLQIIFIKKKQNVYLQNYVVPSSPNTNGLSLKHFVGINRNWVICIWGQLAYWHTVRPYQVFILFFTVKYWKHCCQNKPVL